MSENKFVCKFCNKVLSSSGSLSNHIKKSKKCIAKRKLSNKLKVNEKVKVTSFDCKYCNKNFASKRNLHRHISSRHEADIKLEIMRRKYEHIIEEKDKIIKKCEKDKVKIIEKYENKIDKLEDKMLATPTTTINKNIYIQNNLKCMNDEDFSKYLEHFTEKTMLSGYEAIGMYALEYPLKDKIICIDLPRRIVKFKNEAGEVVKDPTMSRICDKFFDSITDKSKKLREEYNEDDEFIEKYNKDQLREVSKQIEFSGEGYDTKLKRKFIKYICDRTNYTSL